MQGMMEVTLYRVTTGEIVGAGTASGCLAEFADAGAGIATIAGRWAATMYFVRDGTAVPRMAMAPNLSAQEIMADGEDACVISGLPDPCTVSITGSVALPPTAVVGGSVTITATVPGSIHLRVTAEPTHLPWEVTLHAA